MSFDFHASLVEAACKGAIAMQRDCSFGIGQIEKLGRLARIDDFARRVQSHAGGLVKPAMITISEDDFDIFLGHL